MSSDDPIAWIDAAEEALRRGRSDLARRAIARAARLGADPRKVCDVLLRIEGETEPTALLRLSSPSLPAPVRIEAARRLEDAGHLLEALTLVEGVLETRPDLPEALRAMASVQAQIGRLHDARDTLSRLVAVAREAPADHLALAEHFERLGDHEAAAAHVAGAVRGPTARRAELVLARHAVAPGDLDLAADACRRAALGARTSDELLEVAEVTLRGGSPDEAEPLLSAALASRPGFVEALARWAQLSLFRMALPRADELSRAALALDPSNALAQTVALGAAVLSGESERALASLPPPAEQPRLSEYHHFRGEALRKVGRFDEAIEALDHAIALARRYPLSAEAQRLLAIAEREAAFPPPAPKVYDTRDVLVGLAPIIGDVAADTQGEAAPHLVRALEMLGGNRTESPTRLVGGALAGVPVRPSARSASRSQQALLKTRSPDIVLAGFDGLLHDYGPRATIHCHRGEVLLWLGRYEEAEASFRVAGRLDPETRWAWLGLAIAKTQLGEISAARSAFAKLDEIGLRPNGTVYVHRGELELRSGDLDAAREDLERALEASPERPSARLLLALALTRVGEARRAEALLGEAARDAPDLIDRARREGASSTTSLLETALGMMRGNRSSALPAYVGPDGRLRFIMRRPA